VIPLRFRKAAAALAGQSACLFLALSTLVTLTPVTALAHEFGVGLGAYEDFLSGNQAVFADMPVLLCLIATGVFAGIWKADAFPSLWLFLAIGMLVGTVVGLWGQIPPTLPAYATVIAIGLLGAAAPNFPIWLMRSLFVIIGIILTNAVLSGHTFAEVPVFAFVGIAFALNLGVAASASLVAISREKLPYGWVLITWRAGMSWLVAIAIMTMVLMLRSPS